MNTAIFFSSMRQSRAERCRRNAPTSAPREVAAPRFHNLSRRFDSYSVVNRCAMVGKCFGNCVAQKSRPFTRGAEAMRPPTVNRLGRRLRRCTRPWRRLWSLAKRCNRLVASVRRRSRRSSKVSARMRSRRASWPKRCGRTTARRCRSRMSRAFARACRRKSGLHCAGSPS